mgnify:CR=1 FL=1
MKKLSPILWTKNLQETIAFYEQVLGFCSLNGDFPNFVSLTREEVEIMFIVPQEVDFSKPQLTGNLFIVMPQVDLFWEEIKNKVTVKTSIADREYRMRDFSILDNNGYELVFGTHINQ